jgi:glycosyltransferase involved in cell wall biosynthesis
MEAPQMPGTGGQVRSWFFARALSRVTELSLISLGGSGGHSVIPDELGSACHEVIECDPLHGNRGESSASRGWCGILSAVFLPWRRGWLPFLDYCIHFDGINTGNAIPLRRRILARLFAFDYGFFSRFFNLPPLVTHLFSRNFEAVLPQALGQLKGRHFDVLWVEHSMMMPLADRLQKQLGLELPVICNAHNVEWVLNQRMAESAGEGKEQLRSRIQARLLKRLETKVFENARITIVCSEEDKRAALALEPDGNVKVIGNGVDTSYFFRPEKARRSPEPTVLFTGSFGYQPNREGLRYLVEEILPRIHAECPSCRLLVAGAQAASVAEQMGIDDPSIQFVSSPPDIRPCFHEAWVAVVPLLSGGGTRLKILEAMAMECALVSTSMGAEGIPCEHGRHICIADEPAKFAEQVLYLLRDESKRLEQQEVALSWVREHYEWENLTRRLPEILVEATHP